MGDKELLSLGFDDIVARRREILRKQGVDATAPGHGSSATGAESPGGSGGDSGCNECREVLRHLQRELDSEELRSATGAP